MAYQQQQDSRPLLKRPRPVLSCLECRRKKLKCDRLLPCQQCLRIDQPSLCTYAPGQEPESRANAQLAESFVESARRATSIESTQANTAQVRQLNERVQRLEQALRQRQLTELNTDPHSGFGTSLLGTPAYRDHGSLDANTMQPPFEDNFSLFQRFEDAFEFIKSLEQQQNDPTVQSISTRLFAIQHSVASLEPVHTPTVLYTGLPDILQQILQLLPEPRVCNKLIDLYFENFEHCIRILHKSVFLSQNQMFSQRAMHQTQLEYFLPTLVAVLCVASNLHTYPECELPKLRGSRNNPSATQLLKKWDQLIVEQDGVSVAAIQVEVLVIQSQMCQNDNSTDLWIASSQLIRRAMAQRLHVEPPPAISNLESATRKALWLSILEQDLALAIMCGMPPQCPSYDLKPVSNCNDNELSDSVSTSPPERSPHEWTDKLCQCILAATFNKRLEAYKHRFAPRTSSHYSETIEYAKSLETTLQKLPQLFKLDHAANTPSRLMAQLDLDITLRRPLVAIYAPYATATTLTVNVYRDVTIPWVQSHLVVMCFQDLFDPLYPALDVPRPVGYWDFFHTAYRFDAIQSLEAMITEAKYLKQVESGRQNPNVIVVPDSARNSPVKVMRWDFAAMMKAAEDSIGPMTRRIGPCRENIASVVKYTLLYSCLKAPSSREVVPCILDDLETLITNVGKKLESDGYTVQSEAKVTSEPNYDRQWLLNLLRFDT